VNASSVYIYDQSEGGIRQYDIYSLLLSKRIVFIRGEITDELANSIIAQIIYLDSESDKEITVYISSPGGSVYHGRAIYGTFRSVRSKISTVGIGIVASMAALLLLGGDEGRRYALKTSRIMLHQPSIGLGRDTMVKQTDYKILSDELELLRKDCIDVIIKHTKLKDPKEVDRFIESDRYVDANEALQLGIIDKIIEEKEKSPQLPK